MNKSNLASLVFGAISFLALTGCAQPSLAARLIDVSVVNRSTGERLTAYRHHGKFYIAGTPGDNYSIELRSRQSERLLTVLSVDGVNVLTGQSATPLQSGYVLSGRQSYGINGWRKSMNDVAQFVFTALPNSYAARTGRPDNVGVIGVAVFREKTAPPLARYGATAPFPAARDDRRPESARDADEGPARQAAKSESEASTGASKSAASGGLGERRANLAASDSASPAEIEKKSERLGTGHGEREYSPTRYTGFERASDRPDEIIAIYYDSRDNLIARGIIPTPWLAESTPFPGHTGFVPDPRG